MRGHWFAGQINERTEQIALLARPDFAPGIEGNGRVVSWNKLDGGARDGRDWIDMQVTIIILQSETERKFMKYIPHTLEWIKAEWNERLLMI